jgi:hypothetical protein
LELEFDEELLLPFDDVLLLEFDEELELEFEEEFELLLLLERRNACASTQPPAEATDARSVLVASAGTAAPAAAAAMVAAARVVNVMIVFMTVSILLCGCVMCIRQLNGRPATLFPAFAG